MLSSFIMIIIGSIGAAFGPQEAFGISAGYFIYTLSRFIIACGTRGINVTGYVLALEMMSPARRTFAGMGVEYAFSVGQLILVLIAYINNVVLQQDWRSLAITLIVPSTPFLFYFW